jgi:hypothetical protein
MKNENGQQKEATENLVLARKGSLYLFSTIQNVG